MKKSLLAVIILFAVTLSGCATNKFQVRDLNLESGVKTVDFLIEPYQSLGILETEAIRKGEVTTVNAVFPEILFGEYFPARIKWNALGVDEETDREYFGQAAYGGISFTGSFISKVVMDGKNIPKNAKAMIFSTGLDYAYDLLNNEHSFDRSRIGDPVYRKEFILKNGTKISDMKTDDKFISLIKKWNRRPTDVGTFLTPLGKYEKRDKDGKVMKDKNNKSIIVDPFKEIAGINPKYSYSEKLVGSGNFTLVYDYIGVAASLAIDIMMASGAPSEGWDFNSQLPSRRNMALIIKVVAKFQENLISKINTANSELYSNFNSNSKRGVFP